MVIIFTNIVTVLYIILNVNLLLNDCCHFSKNKSDYSYHNVANFLVFITKQFFHLNAYFDECFEKHIQVLLIEYLKLIFRQFFSKYSARHLVKH